MPTFEIGARVRVKVRPDGAARRFTHEGKEYSFEAATGTVYGHENWHVTFDVGHPFRRVEIEDGTLVKWDNPALEICDGALPAAELEHER